MNRQISNETLRDMAEQALGMRYDGVSEDDILARLNGDYSDEDVETYAALQNCFFATYAAYSIGEAAEVAEEITRIFSAIGDGDHFALFHMYEMRIDWDLTGRILDSFDRELARYGRRIVNAIAGDTSAILAD